MLSNLSTKTQVDNIVVFISDSLRYDEFPDQVRSESAWGRAIAASTFTGSGYPSILTGKYPSNHRVWALTETLQSKPPLLNVTPNAGVDATNVWSSVPEPENKPPLRMCHERENTSLSEVESPFTLVVHDFGGHMLYGGNDSPEWNSHDEFFTDLESDDTKIKQLYREGVSESMDRFFEICSELKSRDQFENTLVVLTSDHGELLGEYGGLYDHGAPIVPELVSVPMAFLGAGLPTGRQLDVLLSTTDIVPTVFSALGEEPPAGTDGHDLWSSSGIDATNRVVRSEIWRTPDYPIMSYQATSAWTTNGGIVKHLDSFSARLSYLLGYEYYYASYSNIVRKLSMETRSQWSAYLRSTKSYGDPRDGLADGLPQTFHSEQRTEESTTGPNKQQLRDLGYLE